MVIYSLHYEATTAETGFASWWYRNHCGSNIGFLSVQEGEIISTWIQNDDSNVAKLFLCEVLEHGSLRITAEKANRFFNFDWKVFPNLIIIPQKRSLDPKKMDRKKKVKKEVLSP